ncbi:MAG: hypothetical protein V3U73_06565 [bacterium]
MEEDLKHDEERLSVNSTGYVHSHQFKVISPKKTIDAGGLAKQPNSCNACHYHKNDKPEDMLDVLERVKASGKNRKTFD